MHGVFPAVYGPFSSRYIYTVHVYSSDLGRYVIITHLDGTLICTNRLYIHIIIVSRIFASAYNHSGTLERGTISPSTIIHVLIPYRRKFLHGANFCSFRG